MKIRRTTTTGIALLGAAAAVFYVATFFFPSDEAILRAEFDVPRSAKVISCKTHPDGLAGWFGREGLEIDLVFQFNHQDYAAYLTRAKALGTWQPLPIPREFLLRMGAISTSRASTVRSYELRGDALPDEGSIYNPSEEQLLARLLDNLPPLPDAGLFQCRSAGTDIMHAPKTVHTQLQADLNDFMLGLLDHERRQLIIKVRTYY